MRHDRSWPFGLGARYAVALSLLAGAAAVNAAPLKPGAWSAQGATLTVGEDRTRIEIEGGMVTVDRPIAVGRDGRFKSTGSFEAYAPGPQAADEPPRFKPVQIEGRLEATAVALTLRVAGEAAPRRYVMSEGRRSKTIRQY